MGGLKNSENLHCRKCASGSYTSICSDSSEPVVAVVLRPGIDKVQTGLQWFCGAGIGDGAVRKGLFGACRGSKHQSLNLHEKTGKSKLSALHKAVNQGSDLLINSDS